jgi:enterochelin esterase-like enzyme
VTDRARSARVEQLRADVAADPGSRSLILEQFWAEVEVAGTPLVEPGTHRGERVVTFIWRDGVDDRDVIGPAAPVMVMGGPALWWQIRANVLEPLPGTDVRARSYRADSALRGRYILAPGDPLTDLPPAGTPESVTRTERFRPGRRNPAPFVLTSGDPLRPTVTWSTFALPDATPSIVTGVAAAGVVTCDRLGSRHLGNVRRVWTYRPHPAAGPPRHLLVMLDGRDWIEWTPLTEVLDTLIADRRLPPLTVVLPESLDTAIRYAELTCTDPFTRFLTDELIPWAGDRLPVPADPGRIAVHGISFGGLAAIWAGLERPDTFGTVIAQSGSYWWSGWTPSEQAEVVVERIAGSPRIDGLRVSLDVGTLEGEAMLGSHQRISEALRARGYPMRVTVFSGGHDLSCWLHELPAALEWWMAPGDRERGQAG